MIGEIPPADRLCVSRTLRHFRNKSKRLTKSSFERSVRPRGVRNNKIQKPPPLHRLLVVEQALRVACHFKDSDAFFKVVLIGGLAPLDFAKALILLLAPFR